MRISDWSSDVCSSDLPISPTAWPPPSRCRQAPPRTTAMSTDTDASTAQTCVIAEDEEILRSALESLLREAWPELSVVASCADRASAGERIPAHQAAGAIPQTHSTGSQHDRGAVEERES